MATREDLKREALSTLTEEQRTALVRWLESEADAFNGGEYVVPSYTDGEAGASHGVSAVASMVEEFGR